MQVPLTKYLLTITALLPGDVTITNWKKLPATLPRLEGGCFVFNQGDTTRAIPIQHIREMSWVREG